MNEDVFVIPRAGSIREMQVTRHYIIDGEGKIAFHLEGSKQPQIIKEPRKRGLRYVVTRYRSTRGHYYFKVTDMWTGATAIWSDLDGFNKLEELSKTYSFLKDLVKKEGVYETY